MRAVPGQPPTQQGVCPGTCAVLSWHGTTRSVATESPARVESRGGESATPFERRNALTNGDREQPSLPLKPHAPAVTATAEAASA